MTTAQKQAGLPSEVALHGETKALILQVPDKSIAVRLDTGVPDWVSPLIQIVVAVLGVLAILWQIKNQNKLSLKQHIDTTKAQLRLDAYREFQKIFTEFSASQKVSVDIRLMRVGFQTQLEGRQQNIPVTPLQYREPKFRNALNQLTNNAIDLVFFLERHAPLLPGFEVFKLALGAAISDVNRNYVKFQAVLLRWLPIENPNYGIQIDALQFLYLPIITAKAQEEFQVEMDPILKSIGQLECWASDLSIDIQNHLLGDYADHKVAHRIPIDPDYLVVTSNPQSCEELTRYFKEETEYGRSSSAAEAWARSEQLKRK